MRSPEGGGRPEARSAASRTLVTIGFVAVALSGTTGCTTSHRTTAAVSPSPSPVWLSSARATDEYRSESRTLRLAPGMHWPAKPESPVGPDGKPQYYQAGSAANDADQFWFCSWTKLAQAGRSDALPHVLSVRRTRLYTDGFTQPTRQWLDGILDATARGELTPLAKYNLLNCPTEPAAS